MNVFSDVGWISACRGKCAAGLVLALALPLLSSGCGKKNDTSPTGAPASLPAASNSTPATPASAVTSAPASNAANNAVPDLRPLNQALMDWVYQHGRRPATFEEFAASAGVQIPSLPPGEKYVFNSRGLISVAKQ